MTFELRNNLDSMLLNFKDTGEGEAGESQSDNSLRCAEFVVRLTCLSHAHVSCF